MGIRRSGSLGSFGTWLWAGILALASPLGAVIAPQQDSPLAAREFALPELRIENYHQPIDSLGARLTRSQAGDLARQAELLGAAPESALYDLRAGKWGTLVLAQPLIPGSGWGNQLQWSQLRAAAPRSPEELEAATWDALRSYLQAYRQELNIELEQLGAAPNVAVHDQGRLIQIRAARQVNGVTVRDSFLTATINSGNLILLGTRNWGAVRVSTAATVSKQEAVATLESYIAPHRIASTWHEPSLSLIPTAKVDRLDQVQAGDGYAYRLAWAIGVRIEGDAGSWEALVDAHSGELIAFADQNQYATRRVVGGIYPVSNDGGSTDGIPDGVEQPGHPMPFADVVLPDGTMLTTGSGGLVDAEGPFGTTLSGSFVRINDNCGFIAEATSCTDLDLGSGPGTDCTVPAGDHSLGPHRFLRAEPDHRAGQRLGRSSGAAAAVARQSAHRQHEHQQRLQRVLQPD